MILGRDDVDAQPAREVGLGQLLDVGGAGGRDHRLALEVVDRVDLVRLLRHVAAGSEEVGVGEGNLLLALGIVGGRAAFEVDGAVGHQRDTGRRGHRVELDLELVELELLLHGIDDLVADVHGVADGLLVVVEIGERDRGIAVAERDRAGVLDVLQRAGQLLGLSLARAERGGEREANEIFACHTSTPSWNGRLNA